MADAGQIMQAIGDDQDIDEVALALNERGYRAAIGANVDWICYVISATETMALKNANTTVRGGLDMCKQAIADAHNAGIKVRGSIAVTWVCPYEGKVPVEGVMQITDELIAAGADEVAFNDTVGRATPNDVYELCLRATKEHPDVRFAGHFHDTNFTALANIYAALMAGIEIFDSSAGGLGGCPFSPGASGNIASEKVVWMFENMGITTGVDQGRLQEAGEFAKELERRSYLLAERPE
jgi:hydroxymethylglutaryl-CoA lyase